MTVHRQVKVFTGAPGNPKPPFVCVVVGVHVSEEGATRPPPRGSEMPGLPGGRTCSVYQGCGQQGMDSVSKAERVAQCVHGLIEIYA